MEEIAMKADLLDKIAHANGRELQQLYGLVLNYLNGQADETEWQGLSDIQKRLIEKGLEQADEGLGESITDVMREIRTTYNLHG